MPTKSATSWRDCLKIHSAAADFPRLTPEEMRALGEDIKKNGQRQPIAIIERARRRPDGTFHISDPPLQEVLDGISRLDAMEAAGIAVTGADGQLDKQVLRTVIDTDEVDPIAYVISANIHRRHLNIEQRQHSLIALIARTPEKSDRQIGREIGVDHKTVASARAKGEDVGRIPHVAERKDTKGRKQPSSKPPRKAKPAKVIAPPPQPSNEALQQRAAAAERIRALMGRPAPPPRDDVGPDSANEAERLRSCIEQLEREKRCLELKVAGLEREVADLRAALQASQGPPPDESPEGYWQRSLTALADEVIVRTTYHWPDGWKKFGVPPLLLEHASRAMITWCDLVKQLSTQPILPPPTPKLSAPPADDGLDIPECLDRTKQRVAS
jgi:hypothetical protein